MARQGLSYLWVKLHGYQIPFPWSPWKLLPKTGGEIHPSVSPFFLGLDFMFPLFPPGSPPAPAASESETGDLGKVWSEESAWYWSFMKLKTGPLGRVGTQARAPCLLP